MCRLTFVINHNFQILTPTLWPMWSSRFNKYKSPWQQSTANFLQKRSVSTQQPELTTRQKTLWNLHKVATRWRCVVLFYDFVSYALKFPRGFNLVYLIKIRIFESLWCNSSSGKWKWNCTIVFRKRDEGYNSCLCRLRFEWQRNSYNSKRCW